MFIYFFNYPPNITNNLLLFFGLINGGVGQQRINCQVPSFEDLMSASKRKPLAWDALETYRQGNNQTSDSFHEQKAAVKMNNDAYKSLQSLSATYVKNVGIHGVPGSGKTQCTYVRREPRCRLPIKHAKTQCTYVRKEPRCQLPIKHAKKPR